MNAKELDEIMDLVEQVSANEELNGHMWASSKLDEALRKLEAMRPAYRDPRPEDDGKYCYLEELPSDAPPTLVRIDRQYYERAYLGNICVATWQFWTVSGWRELTEKVCPCERPE